MAGLLQINEVESTTGGLGRRGRAFLELGFRPLYLGATAWAVASIGLWIFAPTWISGLLAGSAWHAHEMLWGFIATIAVGFLLTAGATWTGINPLHGAPLAGLCLCWLVARIGFLLPGQPAFVVAAVSELVFLAWAALALGRVIRAAANRRNAAIPWLLGGLALADGLYLAAARQGDGLALRAHFELGLLFMAILALLIGRRIIPFFAQRALPGLVLPMATRSGQVQLAAVAVAVFGRVADLAALSAAGLVVAGLIALVQVVRWQPWAVRRVPLLWVLYLGHAGLGAGLLVAAGRAAGLGLAPSWPIHIIGLAGFAVLIIGMVTRTSLGHLGRPLTTDRLMVTSFGLVAGAAALRLLALVPGAPQPAFLQGAALAWMLAFGLYLWRFAPWLTRPRPPPPPASKA